MPEEHAIDSGATADSSRRAGATAAGDEPPRRHAASGVAALIAAGSALSRSPTLLPPRAAGALQGTDIAALLTALERLSPMAGDERAEDGIRQARRSAFDRANAPALRTSSALPTQATDGAPSRRFRSASPGEFALSLALLAADAESATDGDAHPAGRSPASRSHGLPPDFAHALRQDLPPPLADLARDDDAHPDGRRGEERQQRQLESLLRIERLLDEAVRLLRQPRAAVFAADAPG